MNQLRAVGETEAGANLNAVVERLVEGQAAPSFDQFLEIVSLDHFHDDVMGSAIAADIMHGDNIRVRHHGDKARFLLEFLEKGGLFG